MSGGNPTSETARPLVEAPLKWRLTVSEDGPKGRGSMYCPNCGAPAWIRHSKRITEKYRLLDFHCTNSACMMAFRAELSVIRILNPGAVMRDDLNVPVAAAEEVAHVMPPRRSGDDPDQSSMFEASG